MDQYYNKTDWRATKPVRSSGRSRARMSADSLFHHCRSLHPVRISVRCGHGNQLLCFSFSEEVVDVKDLRCRSERLQNHWCAGDNYVWNLDLRASRHAGPNESFQPWAFCLSESSIAYPHNRRVLPVLDLAETLDFFPAVEGIECGVDQVCSR